jgi:Reverse transcriptase (RNA-dependent DNA polymerase)
MITEFLNCEEKKAWVVVPKSKVPKGRKIIGNCWVYAEKDDGTFRSLIVVKGFSQIPGKDFQEHHSPAVHDTTFCCGISPKARIFFSLCLNLILLQLSYMDY